MGCPIKERKGRGGDANGVRWIVPNSHPLANVAGWVHKYHTACGITHGPLIQGKKVFIFYKHFCSNGNLCFFLNPGTKVKTQINLCSF